MLADYIRNSERKKNTNQNFEKKYIYNKFLKENKKITSKALKNAGTNKTGIYLKY